MFTERIGNITFPYDRRDDTDKESRKCQYDNISVIEFFIHKGSKFRIMVLCRCPIWFILHGFSYWCVVYIYMSRL